MPSSDESKSAWTQLSQDLSQLSTLGFFRETFTSDEEMDLLVFSDASQKTFGHVVHSLQKGDSNLIFAKVRSAPLKKKTHFSPA